MKRIATALLVIAFVAAVAAPAIAMPGKPSFEANVYADGEAWGTKATTVYDGMKGNNVKSWDKLFVFTNGTEGQLPVSEAAPGNPMYNGGRWYTWTATWTEQAFTDHGTPPVVMSYEEMMIHINLGHIDLVAGSPGGPGAPPDFFQCPLLPVK